MGGASERGRQGARNPKSPLIGSCPTLEERIFTTAESDTNHGADFLSRYPLCRFLSATLGSKLILLAGKLGINTVVSGLLVPLYAPAEQALWVFCLPVPIMADPPHSTCFEMPW